MCKYLIRVPFSDKKLCGWKNDEPYTYFPTCGKDACPFTREDGIIPADLYESPTQIIFYDPANVKRSGIAYKDEVICGCCGAVYGINKVKIEKELFWTDLTEKIKGE